MSESYFLHDTETLHSLLAVYRRNLAVLDSQVANYGSLNVPINVVSQRDIVLAEIDKIATELTKREPVSESKVSETLKPEKMIANPFDQPAIRLNLDTWINLATRNALFIDRLFLEQDFLESDRIFTAFEQFLNVALHLGISVEIVSQRFKISDRLADLEDFRVILAASTLLYSESHTKWLISKTLVLLQENISTISVPFKVWDYICKRYCDHKSEYFNQETLQTILSLSIEKIGRKDYERLYKFFTFLYNLLETDDLSIRYIADYLEQYSEQIGNQAPPSFLERLRRLIGTGKAIAIHGIEDIPPFSPKLSITSGGRICDYKFQAMVYPITNSDFSSISGRLPKEFRDNLSDPYIFTIASDDPYRLFYILASDIISLVELCRQFERESQYDWDVPTGCEWLELAGCESQIYPWGDHPPTHELANLHFGKKAKLRPVGAYPLGVSRFGIHDCCGNVHEIVRFSRSNLFPNDFRLAGGCYQTSFERSSCQIFRPFKTKEEDNRRNVGLRLIRYLRSDEAKRFQALERFLEEQKRKSKKETPLG